MNRIPALDGWRGIAILLVVAEHCGQHRFAHQMWAGLGSLGVDIFFVLSGYIITARLIEERERTSSIHLASFYIRRAIRILPLVVCYLGVLCVLSEFRNMDLSPSQIAGTLFFFRDYQYAAHPEGLYTAQFWSLSIEEHFYLLWPVILLRFNNRRAAWIAATGACLCAIWRIYDGRFPGGLLGRMLPGGTSGLRSLRTDTRLDGLMLGCALAILLVQPSVRNFVQRNFPKETPLLCATLLVLNVEWHNGYFTTLTNYMLITLMITSTLIVKEGLAYQWLNSKVLVGVGAISYSLYVWQQLFLVHPETAYPLGKLDIFPYNLVCALVVASGSYYLVERPTARLGRRLTQASHQEGQMPTSPATAPVLTD